MVELILGLALAYAVVNAPVRVTRREDERE